MKPVKHSSGLYRMQVQLNGSRKDFYGKTPKECKAKYERWNGIVGAVSVPFRAAFDIWMDEFVSQRSNATYEQYSRLGKAFITPILGAIKVEKILPLNCQSVLDAAKKADGSPLSKTTLGHIRKIMHAFFEHERVMKKSIKENPCHDLVLPETVSTRKRRSATPAELTKIWKAAETSHYNYCYQFLLISGFRPSEVCGIKIPTKSARTITISEARTRMDVSSGKSVNAYRAVDISPVMRAIIQKQLEYMKEKQIASVYLFPQRDGQPSNSGYLTRNWQRLKEKAGVKVSIYELRHTFVSLTIDKMPLKDLQQRIGHSSKMDTTGTYGHVFKSKNKHNSRVVDESISKYLPLSTAK